MLFQIWVLLSFGVIFVQINVSNSANDEQRLYKDLMQTYNKYERPVENNSQSVTVKLGVVLNQIIDVDEKNQVIQINLWLNYEWYDYNLRWEPKEYGGVEDLRFPADKLWRPDVLLYNSVDSAFDTTFATNFVVYSSGTVVWIPPCIVKSTCKINIRYFPFDEQLCHLKFGSWTYSGKKLNLVPNMNHSDISEYMPNGEWLLLDVPVQRQLNFSECCPDDPYPTLHFYIHIKRRTLYYGFNLIIPGLIIAVMTILGFTLPPDAGEKITLEITILLSICLYMNIVSNMSPPTSEAVPLLSIFFMLCMSIVSASVVFTIVVLNFHFRTGETHEMSDMTRAVLLNWLPWMLRMKRPGQKFSSDAVIEVVKQKIQQNKSFASFKSFASLSSESNFTVRKDNPDKKCSKESHQTHQSDYESLIQKYLQQIEADGQNNKNVGLTALLLSMQRIYSKLKAISDRMEHEDETIEARNDWKFAAKVVDKLCLVIFSTVMVGITSFILAPFMF